MFYRGQANKEWNIIAGAFRKDFSTTDEQNLLKQASLKLYKELSEYPYYLDKLAFLQHYGMPTRLLDVTFNPLVALFFACKTEIENDGIVYYGHKKTENETVAELTAKYLFKYNLYFFDDNISRFLSDEGGRITKEDFSEPIFIYPPINNPRIEHQSGAFFITPLTNDKTRTTDIDNKNTNMSLRNCFMNDVAVIPKTLKEKIINELSEYGIDEGSIFQTVPEKINSIIQENQRNPIKNISLEEDYQNKL